MDHPRRTAAVLTGVTGVTGLLAVSACLAAGPTAQPPAPRVATDPGASAGPWARFRAPLHVPAPPVPPAPRVDPGPAPGPGVLGPGTVVVPPPAAPAGPPHAVVRPA
ncbi:hypothetical protein AB2L27_12730 [Kineococcus sp. LSe6-4]|uniref:Uncharacterized protein n=1 Tax=Kineococcus halophytocola TaxID=3234027 RepID=A0ABV4H3G1_9ACTN